MFQCFYDVDVDEGYIVYVVRTYPITSKWNSEERLEVARDYSSLRGWGGGGETYFRLLRMARSTQIQRLIFNFSLYRLLFSTPPFREKENV
jgi:hypothetical protein